MSRHDRSDAEIARIRSLLTDAGVAVPAAPVPDTSSAAAPDHGAHDLAPQDLALLRRLTADEHPSPRRPWTVPAAAPRTRTWAPRLAVAASLVLVLVTAGLWWPSSTPPAGATTPPVLSFSELQPADVLDGATRSAQATLEALAEAAATNGYPAGTGSQEVSSYAWYLNLAEGQALPVVLVPTFQTTVLGPDGSFTNHEVRSTPLDLEGDVVDPMTPPAGGDESFDSLPAGTFVPGAAEALPRDPEALTEALVAQYGGAQMCEASPEATASCLFSATLDLYGRTVVPADLSSALWSALAAQPAFVDLGTTTDRLGRDGVAVAVPPVPGRIVQTLILVIDPENGRLLEWDWVNDGVADAGLVGPTMTGFQAFISSRWIP